MPKFIPHLSSCPLGCSWGFSFCLQSFRLWAGKAWQGRQSGGVIYLLNNIFMLNWQYHLTDSNSNPSPLQYSLNPWATSVLTFSNAVFSIGASLYIPDFAGVSVRHSPAGSLTYPGVSVLLPNTALESTVQSECSPVQERVRMCVHVYFARGTLMGFFLSLRDFFSPSLTSPHSLRNHCHSMMACMLQATLYWGRVSCTLPVFEEEAVGTTPSLNNDNNYFQQTDNLFLAGYSLTLQPM